MGREQMERRHVVEAGELRYFLVRERALCDQTLDGGWRNAFAGEELLRARLVEGRRVGGKPSAAQTESTRSGCESSGRIRFAEAFFPFGDASILEQGH